jgi:transposase
MDQASVVSAQAVAALAPNGQDLDDLAVPTRGENRARPPAPLRKPTTTVRLNSSSYSCAVPEPARAIVEVLGSQLNAISGRIDEIDARINAWHKANPVSQRLATIPGIGPLIATAIAATVADPAAFRSAREFAAWVGLTPRQEVHRRQAAVGAHQPAR